MSWSILMRTSAVLNFIEDKNPYVLKAVSFI
ncbi:hypothetical protein SAMN05443633_102383 [Chryseobacterium arachidis]|uniref:Uncharacterized protein n=1 Tax=Chryseobacterium arachidis TaxID=1416778 RepID=A0A1M4XP79_9FLAO|nr:hypothetical protein SAMN05443633_102383 [Chryseobacterium arachidis]